MRTFETMDESIYHGFTRLVMCVFSDHAPDNVSPFGSSSSNIVAKGWVVSFARLDVAVVFKQHGF